MPKTAQFIAELSSVKEPKKVRGADRKPRQMNPNSINNLAPPWPKGFCANPGGQNQHDAAKMISQMIFEHNYQAIYEAQLGAILQGNAYAYKEHADRAFGKLKEQKEVTHLYQDVADADLQRRLDEILRDLGLARAIDEAGGGKADPTGVGAPAVSSEDS